jgi:hypothetical protein
VCGLINPPNAHICDCGYNFETRNKGNPIAGSITSQGCYRSLDGKKYELASLGERLGGQFLDALTGASPILIGSLIFQKIADMVSGNATAIGHENRRALLEWAGCPFTGPYYAFNCRT